MFDQSAQTSGLPSTKFHRPLTVENGFLLCFKASLDSYRTTDHHALLRHIDSLLNGIKESHFCDRFQSYLGCRNLKDGERGEKKG